MTVTAESQTPLKSASGGRRLRRVWRSVWFGMVAGLVLFVAGFFYFASLVQQSVHATSENTRADGIIVLTGGSERITDALGLLRDERGTRLLISGVNPRTTANQLARRTGTARALFNCCIDLGYDAQNTLGNAVEGARWATRHEFDSLILVTSAYHMPRAMMEFGRLMPQAELVAWPVKLFAYNSDRWWHDPGTIRVLLGEYGKYVLAATRMRFGEATLPLSDEIVRSQMQ
jgi:uncharacterized SAM-binding protein YcdF (DUF218 family)